MDNRIKMMNATSDFRKGLCRSCKCSNEKHVSSTKKVLLNVTSMTLAFIQINNFSFSQDRLGTIQDITF